MFLEYMDSKFSESISIWEVNLYLALQGTALLLLPPLAFASIFKLGKSIILYFYQYYMFLYLYVSYFQQ